MVNIIILPSMKINLSLMLIIHKKNIFLKVQFHPFAPSDALWRYINWSVLVRVYGLLYVGTKLTSEPMFKYMMMSTNGNMSVLLALCVRGIPQSPVTRGFDVFLDLRLNKWLRKQSRSWWFETSSRSLWCHCNLCRELVYYGEMAVIQWTCFFLSYHGRVD